MTFIRPSASGIFDGLPVVRLIRNGGQRLWGRRFGLRLSIAAHHDWATGLGSESAMGQLNRLINHLCRNRIDHRRPWMLRAGPTISALTCGVSPKGSIAVQGRSMVGTASFDVTLS
jgi:hypothetical protein